SIFVMRGPSPRCTLAVVRISFTVCPAFSSSADRYIEKQPACAAPISSSGLVPGVSPKRVPKLNGPSKAPLPSFMRPEPCFSVPCHEADAFRTVISDSYESGGKTKGGRRDRASVARDFQQDLADVPRRLHQLVRGARVGEIEDFENDRLHGAGLQQWPDVLAQLRRDVRLLVGAARAQRRARPVQ